MSQYGHMKRLPPIVNKIKAHPNADINYYHDVRVGAIKKSFKKFKTQPTKCPLTLCVQVTPYKLDHTAVLDMAKKRLLGDQECHVLSIQYVARNVIQTAGGLEDRWLITVNCERAKKAMLRGFYWKGVPLVVRNYDDVVNDEYQNYLRLNRLSYEMKSLGF